MTSSEFEQAGTEYYIALLGACATIGIAALVLLP